MKIGQRQGQSEASSTSASSRTGAAATTTALADEPQDIDALRSATGAVDRLEAKSVGGATPAAEPTPGLSRGSRGGAVTALQDELNALGARPPLSTDGVFGPKTEFALKAFQQENRLPVTGKLDDATLLAIERGMAGGFSTIPALPEAQRPPRGADAEVFGERARILADAARDVARTRATVGRCAAGVGDALEAIGVGVRAPSAYLLAEKLAARDDFVELEVERRDLNSLPPGAVVVWGRSAKHAHGHVAITVGAGREASDHEQRMLGGSYGSDFGAGPTTGGSVVRVFVPRDET